MEEHPAVRQAGAIWSVRDGEKVSDALRAPLAVSHPDLGDFCDDYTDGQFAPLPSDWPTFHVVPDIH
jgi:hypothetical protein